MDYLHETKKISRYDAKLTHLTTKSFVSNIKIVHFVFVHCLFDMNCDCLRSLKLQ